MENSDNNQRSPKPLTEEERTGQNEAAEQIKDAVLNNRGDEASLLRSQLAQAAKLGVISKKVAIDTSFPPATGNDKNQVKKR
ncbi:hypothetical protein JXA63_01410 [Candidatus Woesebacteria bacterium]|nr:hypothetical protein [Candidatus Woesebacteria bacterium]